MKRLYKLVSIVCVIAAGLLEAFGIFAIFTSEEPLWRGLALFNLATRGTTAGFIFSIVGVLLSTLAYSTLGYYGLLKYRDAGEQKCALIWCICTVAFTFLSLLLAACNGTVTLVDVLLPTLSVGYFMLLRETRTVRQ